MEEFMRDTVDPNAELRELTGCEGEPSFDFLVGKMSEHGYGLKLNGDDHTGWQACFYRKGESYYKNVNGATYLEAVAAAALDRLRREKE